MAIWDEEKNIGNQFEQSQWKQPNRLKRKKTRVIHM